MKKMPQALLGALIGALIAAMLLQWTGEKGDGQRLQAEPTFARVSESQTLRCGYILYDPIVTKDPNTGALAGVLVDAINEMGKRLDWQVQWVEELSFTTRMEGLKTGRYDMVCTALWGFPETAKIAEFVGPFLYEPIGVWVRADDHRFDENIGKINDPSVTISGVDGTFPAKEAKNFFPKAKLNALPQFSDYAAPFMDIVTRKADVTFINNNMGLAFLRTNPGSLRNIAADPPFRIFPIYVALDKGEFKLRSLLNSVLDLMHNDGTMEQILKRYEKNIGAFYPVAYPYRIPRS